MGEVRTPNEVAGLRAAADVAASRSSQYDKTVARAVTDTLDWLEGHTTVSPITGDHAVEPDRKRVVLERIRAEDAEQAAMRAGGGGTTSVYPGKVGHVLSWYVRRADTEVPLVV